MAKLNVELSKSTSRDLVTRGGGGVGGATSIGRQTNCSAKEGIYCAAKSGNDGIWFRAQVIHVLDTGE